MNWTTIAARGAAVTVAAVAGAASFEHIASVAISAGERQWVGYALPLAIDGLIVVGVAALLEDKRNQRRGRLSARLAVLVGVVATLAANVASAEPTPTARLVAVTAPLSFLLSVEVLTRTGGRQSVRSDATVAKQSTSATSGASPEPAAPTPASRARASAGTGAGTGRRRRSSAERVSRVLADIPDATTAEVAAMLNLTERTVQRYWPVPAVDAPRGPVPSASGPSPTAGRARPAGVGPVSAASFKPLHSRRNNHDRPKVPA